MTSKLSKRASERPDAPLLPPGIMRFTATGRFQAVYRDANGRRHSSTHETLAQAKAWRDDQLTDVRRGVHLDPNGGRVRFGAWTGQWWEARVVEETTRRANRSRLDTHVLPAFEDYQLGKITRIQVQAWVRRLERGGLAAATVRACFYLLEQILDDARKEGLIPALPAVDIDLPALPPGREVYLTREQVAAIVGKLTEPYATLILFLAYTGLRWGEATGLRVRSLDMLRGRVTVRETMTRHGPKAYPKGRATRQVPLPPHVAERVAVLLARRKAGRDDLVFVGPRGGPLDGGNVRERHWQPALTATGVGLEPTLHDLRHSCASWLVQDGVPMAAVQRHLGHRSITTSMRYAHLAPEQDYGVAASLAPRESGAAGSG